jgi:hypothetical protein
VIHPKHYYSTLKTSMPKNSIIGLRPSFEDTFHLPPYDVRLLNQYISIVYGRDVLAKEPLNPHPGLNE